MLIKAIIIITCAQSLHLGVGQTLFLSHERFIFTETVLLTNINTPSRRCRVHSKHMEMKSNAQKMTEGGIQKLV